jgi:hypothetical protein
VKAFYIRAVWPGLLNKSGARVRAGVPGIGSRRAGRSARRPKASGKHGGKHAEHQKRGVKLLQVFVIAIALGIGISAFSLNRDPTRLEPRSMNVALSETASSEDIQPLRKFRPSKRANPGSGELPGGNPVNGLPPPSETRDRDAEPSMPREVRTYTLRSDGTLLLHGADLLDPIQARTEDEQSASEYLRAPTRLPVPTVTVSGAGAAVIQPEPLPINNSHQVEMSLGAVATPMTVEPARLPRPRPSS